MDVSRVILKSAMVRTITVICLAVAAFAATATLPTPATPVARAVADGPPDYNLPQAPMTVAQLTDDQKEQELAAAAELKDSGTQIGRLGFVAYAAGVGALLLGLPVTGTAALVIGTGLLAYGTYQYIQGDQIQKSWGISGKVSSSLRVRSPALGALARASGHLRFKQVAKPRRVPSFAFRGRFGRSAVGQAEAAGLRASLQSAELGRAFKTSLSRAIEAHDTHHKRWTVRQLAAAARYARKGARLFAQMSGLRAKLITALEATGFPATLNLPATKGVSRRTHAHAVKRTLKLLPKSVKRLLKRPPLRGVHLRSVIAHVSAGSSAGGNFSLAALNPPALTAREQRLASDLRRYAKVITHVKPGRLPAGLAPKKKHKHKH